MPLERSSSADCVTLRMDNLVEQELSEENPPNGHACRMNEDNQRLSQHNHMTLDGRRRPRNSPENVDDRWDDWTSTWRRMGNKGQSKSVTMTGTITRGKRKGEVVDVQLDLTRRELLEISHVEENVPSTAASTPGSVSSLGLQPKSSNCTCGIQAGPHIFLLSVIALPFVLVASMMVSFYFGALTWQNVFSHFYDERTVWHRISICPILVLTFPVFIVLFTLGIALYAALVQLRWSFANWKIEVSSLEKGFYGWLCGVIALEDCSPYTVIELFSGSDLEGQQTHDGGRIEVSYREPGGQAVSGRRTRRQLPGDSGHSQMHRVESAI